MFASQETVQGRNLFRGFWWNLYLQSWKSLAAMEAQNGAFSPSLDDEPETVPSESFMEYLRDWYASSNQSMGMTRPSTELFDENGIHTPRSPLLTPSSFPFGNHQEENQVLEVLGQEVGQSSSPLEYILDTEALDTRGTSAGSWGSMYVELLDIYKNESVLPESLASMFAEFVSTWNSEVDSYLTTGSDREFEDSPDYLELDELNIMVDLLCPHCDYLVYRPFVLNCGHVFCERCIAVPRGSVLKCPSCKRHQPGLLPQVCDELDAYLRKAFPLEYTEQANRVPQVLKPVYRFGCLPSEIRKGLDICTRRRQHLVAINNALVCDSFPVPGTYPRRIVENIGPVLRGPLHYGIVCDGCGMVPIIGPRFECRDCTKEFGFDLCETCHRSGFDLTGHVNQEHTSDHRMQVWNNRRKKDVMKRNQITQRGRCLASHCAREAEMALDKLGQV
ncbi:hypothetical protein M758_10G086300 [Ceratodon purpureus]|nr:hypothetical protein M758_10G086300 [Ceratodon purpureus]